MAGVDAGSSAFKIAIVRVDTRHQPGWRHPFDLSVRSDAGWFAPGSMRVLFQHSDPIHMGQWAEPGGWISLQAQRRATVSLDRLLGLARGFGVTPDRVNGSFAYWARMSTGEGTAGAKPVEGAQTGRQFAHTMQQTFGMKSVSVSSHQQEGILGWVACLGNPQLRGRLRERYGWDAGILAGSEVGGRSWQAMLEGKEGDPVTVMSFPVGHLDLTQILEGMLARQKPKVVRPSHLVQEARERFAGLFASAVQPTADFGPALVADGSTSEAFTGTGVRPGEVLSTDQLQGLVHREAIAVVERRRLDGHQPTSRLVKLLFAHEVATRVDIPLIQGGSVRLRHILAAQSFLMPAKGEI